ncbi:MAG: amidase family protein [Proteobacteria bacterium]|nr:amidase family protein [Pseudomonadota bacterium]
MTELYQLSARDVVAKLKNKEVSPVELIDAAEARISAVEGDINALPTLCFERAREAATKVSTLDDRTPGWLGGLPIAVKDMSDVAGVRTTYGSPIYADHVPATSDLTVEILEQRGALVVAKSNTPEFAAGANTFNEVFGATINPWGAGLCAGGSSGGSAAALAAGEVWLATGSDLGGSLRTPASFCGVVGLRPSPGRVPRSAATPFDTLSVAGPMARDVRDAALFLDAMVGTHPRDPLAVEIPAQSFQSAANNPAAPKRVAFSPDLGQLPVARDVREICTAAVNRVEDLGTVVDEQCPDFSGAYESFQTLRAVSFVSRAGYLLKNHRDLLKPEIIWNAEKGLELTPQDIARANDLRGALNASMGALFEDHDFFVCPAAPVRPFDVTIRYVEEIEGAKLKSYVDWIAITFMITLTGCPAISIPCGFSEDGLPIGLQIVAPPRGEAKLLSAAAAIEDMFGISSSVPIDPKT